MSSRLRHIQRQRKCKAISDSSIDNLIDRELEQRVVSSIEACGIVESASFAYWLVFITFHPTKFAFSTAITRLSVRLHLPLGHRPNSAVRLLPYDKFGYHGNWCEWNDIVDGDATKGLYKHGLYSHRLHVTVPANQRCSIISR